MSSENFIFDEAEIASLLKNEILKESNFKGNEIVFDDFEFILDMRKPKPSTCITPIMTMNQDEMLEYVCQDDTKEIAQLSSEELNRFSEIIGINSKILTEGVE